MESIKNSNCIVRNWCTSSWYSHRSDCRDPPRGNNLRLQSHWMTRNSSDRLWYSRHRRHYRCDLWSTDRLVNIENKTIRSVNLSLAEINLLLVVVDVVELVEVLLAIDVVLLITDRVITVVVVVVVVVWGRLRSAIKTDARIDPMRIIATMERRRGKHGHEQHGRVTYPNLNVRKREFPSFTRNSRQRISFVTFVFVAVLFVFSISFRRRQFCPVSNPNAKGRRRATCVTTFSSFLWHLNRGKIFFCWFGLR